MSSAVVPDVVPPGGGRSVSRSFWWWGVAALAISISFLYKDILFALVLDWWRDPDFSHGFVVPLISAYLVWQRRQTVERLPLKPSWWGLVVIVAAICILLLGILGAELFLSRSSFIFLLAGMVIFFLGWAQFCALIFPWALLFLMVPIPAILMNQITLPLQFLASHLGAGLLVLAGVPVLREGNVIHLPTISLEVAEACSGIRSLVSLITLAVVYSYLLEQNNVIRVLLVSSALPIAIAANGLRIMGTGLAGNYWSPDKAEGFFHEFSGWVIFVLSLLMLLGLHKLIRFVARRSHWRAA